MQGVYGVQSYMRKPIRKYLVTKTIIEQVEISVFSGIFTEGRE